MGICVRTVGMGVINGRRTLGPKLAIDCLSHSSLFSRCLWCLFGVFLEGVFAERVCAECFGRGGCNVVLALLGLFRREIGPSRSLARWCWPF